MQAAQIGAIGDRPRRRSWPRALVMLAACAAVGALVLEYWYPIHQRFVPKQFSVVEPGRIYRSGQISEPLIRKTLEQHGIRTVVALQDYDERNPSHVSERAAIQALGIRELHFRLRGDGSGDVRSYASALSEMARAVRDGQPLLVHCAAGTERTGAAVGFFRMLVQRRPSAEAYEEMVRGGWEPEDNPQLPEYMNRHMKELAELLVADGVIESVPDPLPVIGK
jgi:protein tyrosine/serine phosphatase